MKSLMLRAGRFLSLGSTALAVYLSPVCMAAAAADPVSIGSFVISAFLSVGAGGVLPAVSAAAIGNFVIGAAVIGASIISSVLAPKPSVNPGEYKNTFETGDSSEIRAIGRVRVGGLKVFGNTNNRYRYRLIAHTKGLWTATEEHFLGGREVTVEEDGRVTTPPYVTRNSSWIKIWTKTGDGAETAWSELMTMFPSLWTTDHRVRGIHQSLVEYLSPGLTPENSDKHLKLYQNGEPPYEKVGRAEPVYDPRDGTQSASDAATWKWDDNGILCAAHVLRSYPSMAVADFDYDDIALQAAAAEAIVATKTGTEELAKAAGVWPAENPRGEVMEQVLRSISAEIVPTLAGKYSIRLIGDERVPEVNLTQRHLIDYSLRFGPEGVERPNVCRIKYYSPERNYEMTEINLDGIEWARVQDEVDRYGEQIYDIDLPFCPSASQAQRIGRRLFALARADQGVAKFNFAGMAAWGCHTASIEFPDIGEAGGSLTKVCAINTPRINDDEGTVEIPFIVWPALPTWDPETMEAAAPEPIPELLYESELDTPIAPSAATVVQYAGGGEEVRVAFTAVDDADVAEGNVRTYSDGEPNAWQSMEEPGLTFAYRSGSYVGQQADFRVRFYDDDDNGSYPSPMLSVPSLAIDNTACGAPSLSLSGDVNSPPIIATASASELRAATITFSTTVPAIAPQTFDVRPGATVTYSVPPPAPSGPSPTTYTISAVTKTSDGTAGPAATESFEVPGNGA